MKYLLLGMRENIEVTTLFKDTGVPIPKSFKLGSREYRIARVSLVHAIKQGARRVLIFNVADEGGERVLIFDTENLRWQMELAWRLS